MTIHNRLRRMVIRNLALPPQGNGVLFRLNKIVDNGYNTYTGDVDQLVVSHTGTAVRINYSEYNHKFQDIPKSDFQLYVSPIDAAGNEMPKPDIDDEITFLSLRVKVIEVNPFNENGEGCGWKLRVRSS